MNPTDVHDSIVSVSLDEDLQAVRLAQGGDALAFDGLVRKYQHRVIAVVGRYIGDWSECQDVAQDVFVRVYRALPGFRGESQFSSWIHRIAVNTALNHIDARKRRPPQDDIELSDAELYGNHEGLQSNASPEQELLRQELLGVLQAAMNALPDDLRIALTLREIDGLTYEQIAEQMNTPIGTVRSRIFRARDAIDQKLQNHMPKQTLKSKVTDGDSRS